MQTKSGSWWTRCNWLANKTAFSWLVSARFFIWSSSGRGSCVGLSWCCTGFAMNANVSKNFFEFVSLMSFWQWYSSSRFFSLFCSLLISLPRRFILDIICRASCGFWLYRALFFSRRNLRFSLTLAPISGVDEHFGCFCIVVIGQLLSNASLIRRVISVAFFSISAAFRALGIAGFSFSSLFYLVMFIFAAHLICCEDDLSLNCKVAWTGKWSLPTS